MVVTPVVYKCFGGHGQKTCFVVFLLRCNFRIGHILICWVFFVLLCICGILQINKNYTQQFATFMYVQCGGSVYVHSACSRLVTLIHLEVIQSTNNADRVTGVEGVDTTNGSLQDTHI